MITDLWDRVKRGVEARIASHPLIQAEVKGGVVGQILEDNTNVEFPHVAVVLDGMSEATMPGDTEHCQMDYPVLVLIRDQIEIRQQGADDQAKYLGWRKAITNLFHQGPKNAGGNRELMDGVPECYKTSVRLRPAIDSRASWFSKMVSAMEVHCETWESRS